MEVAKRCAKLVTPFVTPLFLQGMKEARAKVG
jgi:hypothetical protein